VVIPAGGMVSRRETCGKRAKASLRPRFPVYPVASGGHTAGMSESEDFADPEPTPRRMPAERKVILTHLVVAFWLVAVGCACFKWMASVFLPQRP
jgi:hypothetical protein